MDAHRTIRREGGGPALAFARLFPHFFQSVRIADHEDSYLQQTLSVFFFIKIIVIVQSMIGLIKIFFCSFS